MHWLASTLFQGFGNVFVFAAFGAIFVWLNLFVLGKLVLRRPEKPDQGDKRLTYECGEPTIGDAWVRFDIRFYTLSLIFLIFDIEVALLFPWAAAYDSFIEAGYGPAAFVEVLFFLVVLGVGLAYVWLRRDLEWTSTRPGRAVSDEVLEEGVVHEPEYVPASEETTS
jgi:NADH-quinone oxidoreductase subunit A